MFTGIVNQVGVIGAIKKSDAFWQLSIKPEKPYENITLGESFCVSGVCLSVEDTLENGMLLFSCVQATLAQTTLQHLSVGSKVNLERALTLADRLGGHVVQGHVDGLARIKSIIKNTSESLLTIACPPVFEKWLVPKGYMTVDGMSLTIQSINENQITIALVPITESITITKQYQEGDYVNLEADINVKTIVNYLERIACHKLIK